MTTLVRPILRSCAEINKPAVVMGTDGRQARLRLVADPSVGAKLQDASNENAEAWSPSVRLVDVLRRDWNLSIRRARRVIETATVHYRPHHPQRMIRPNSFLNIDAVEELAPTGLVTR